MKTLWGISQNKQKSMMHKSDIMQLTQDDMIRQKPCRRSLFSTSSLATAFSCFSLCLSAAFSSPALADNDLVLNAFTPASEYQAQKYRIHAPSDFETAEYNGGGGLDQINASTAYDRGATGDGVIVAVTDSGVDVDHPDLAANIAPGGFDFIDEDETVTPEGQDPNGGASRSHGTHVAGIIAATRNNAVMHGVAYNARILPIRIFDSTGTGFVDFAGLVNQAVADGARVVNNSWGGEPGGSPGLNGASITALRAAREAGVVMVFSAGNESSSQPSPQSLIPLSLREFENNWLAVVAVDDNNNLASFSNACGSAMWWCLAAPGVNILSTVDQDDDAIGSDYAFLSGTSMAAPHVSGAVAVLMDMFPNLNSEEVVDILLSTSTDLGAEGVDEIYGHGLVNLEAATQPIGDVVVPVQRGNQRIVRRYDLSRLIFSNAFGAGAVSAFEGIEIAVLDSYNRIYTVPLDAVTTTQDNFDIETVLDRFATADNRNTIALDQRFALQYSFKPATETARNNSRTAFSPGYNSAGYTVDQVSVRYGLRSGQELKLGINTGVAENFGAFGEYSADSDAIARADLRVADSTLTNPYLSFVTQGINASYQMPLNGMRNWNLRIGGFFGNDEEESDAKSVGGLTELERRFKNGMQFAWQVGAVIERSRLLGSESDGALMVEEGTPTAFTGFSARSQVGQKNEFLATAYVGYTRPELADNTVISEFSGIVSQAFSVGYARKEIFGKKDRMQVSISQPLRSVRSTASMLLPVVNEDEYRIDYEERIADLSSSGREIDLEASYSRPFGKATRFSTGFIIRHNPGHDPSADMDVGGVFRFSHRF